MDGCGGDGGYYRIYTFVDCPAYLSLLINLLCYISVLCGLFIKVGLFDMDFGEIILEERKLL